MGSGMRDAGCGMRGAGCGMQGARAARRAGVAARTCDAMSSFSSDHCTVRKRSPLPTSKGGRRFFPEKIYRRCVKTAKGFARKHNGNNIKTKP